MVYIATKRESTEFHYLHREIGGILGLYQNQKGMKLDGSVSSWGSSGYEDFVVRKKRLFFNHTILTISPPYTPKDVHVRDHKFRDLGEQIKNEIAKHWVFGRCHQYQGEEDIMREYRGQVLYVLLSHGVERIEGPPDESVRDGHLPFKITAEEIARYMKSLESAISEVDRQRLVEITESKN